MADPEAQPASLAKTGRAALILTAGAVVVQAVGFLRQVFLAANIGIDSGLDALLVASATPSAFVALLAAGVSVALVPAYIQAKEDRGALAARRLSGTVLVWVGGAGLAASVTVWLFADEIIAILGPGLAEVGTAGDAVRYLRLLAPMTFLSSVAAILYAACQAERMFVPMTISTVVGPIFALALLVYFWDSLALDGYVLGTIADGVIAIGTLMVAMILRRVAPSPRLVSRGLGLTDLARHAVPLSLSRMLIQVRGIFDRAIATLLLPGGVSALRYGDSLVRLPFSAIMPAYNRATYPTLVYASRDSTQSDLGATTERLIRYGLVFFVPLAGLTIAVAPLAAAILYGRGAFGEADLKLTAHVVAISAPLIVTWTVQPTLVSALNARRKGTILLASGIMTMAGNIVLDVLLGYTFGVTGIPMATVIMSVVAIAFMGDRLARLEPTLSPRRIWRTFLRSVLATLPSALVFGILIWARVFDGGFAERVVLLVFTGVAGLASYYAIARRLGLTETDSIIAFGVNTARRILPR